MERLKRLKVRVDSGSPTAVGKKHSSVNSGLIGERIELRISKHRECCLTASTNAPLKKQIHMVGFFLHPARSERVIEVIHGVICEIGQSISID